MENKFFDEREKLWQVTDELTENLRENNKELSIKYLHLMVDNIYSKIFIDFINKYFDMSEHYFLVWGWDEDGIKHIDIDSYYNVEQQGFIETLVYCNISEKVFIHYLTPEKVRVVNASKNPEKFHWIFWGYDFYSNLDISIYGKLTKDFIDKIGVPQRNIDTENYNHICEAINKIPYILHYIEEDYNLIKRHFATSAKLLPFFYPNACDYNYLDTIKSKENLVFNLREKFKYIIQLGNSSTPSNNHLEILHLLKNINSEEFCVIVPLSYGSSLYADELVKKGVELLGERFIPIKSFLDVDSYFYLLSQVDIAIMNHKIQQGVGNTLALLYMGKKVYLNPKTTTYKYLSRLGINICSLEDINDITLEDMVKYSDKYSSVNKKIIKNNFSELKARENLQQILHL